VSLNYYKNEDISPNINEKKLIFYHTYKMEKKGGQLEELTNAPISECAGDQTGMKIVCSRVAELDKMRKFLESKGVDTQKMSPKKIIADTQKTLGVDKESQIYKNPIYVQYIGKGDAQKIVDNIFKPVGPADSTKLLSNYDIDKTMYHWMQTYPKFYHVPYQMIDFAEQNTELANLDIWDLINKKYESFGVVLNTDISSGDGKHWFCIYGDLKHKGTESDPIVIEFFNSSGNPPREEIIIWSDKIKAQLFVNHKMRLIVDYPVVGTRIQHSDTECGMWCLVFIWSRLVGKPSKWILDNKVNDNEIIEARKKFFRK
jgi:hypothetical protein